MDYIILMIYYKVLKVHFGYFLIYLKYQIYQEHHWMYIQQYFSINLVQNIMFLIYKVVFFYQDFKFVLISPL